MMEPKAKYDRQLIQGTLEEASICLLNCGPIGSNALKNLVLGGVGSITIVEGSKLVDDSMVNLDINDGVD
ncbi:unnamed protein product [Arabidopsis thaliana]|uniref:THIF-type NAD/FAD binding fold domain-containing protein n=1 Tax=Arabidopsis thaliana TaxID=3702 RepID=A0A5S9XFX7_ARATH|nr:unnamed protein product [Arabidopsis thaliana]